MQSKKIEVKGKLLSLVMTILFGVILLAVMTTSANAKWWDENPFSDVNSNSWYYDAVRIVYENELFSGTSATSFSPSTKMTRAMLVQVLASADGYDSSDYAGSYFNDVPADKWYSSAVEWARINGVTAGTSETKFSPHLEITREQLATMLKRFAEYKGIVSGANADSMLAFEDLNEVSDWAENGINWAVENEIISGVEQGGTLYLKPKASAKRSECAQMLSQFLYLNPIREINGNDISLYSIVYSASEIESVQEAAEELADYFKRSLGVELPVVTDEGAVGEYEILVGRTNREEKGIVTVDRASFRDDQNVYWSVQGNYLVVTGIDSYHRQDDGSRTTKNIDGTDNAVFYFAEEELGVTVYSNSHGRGMEEDGLKEYEPDPVISLNDGYTRLLDGPYFEERIFYMSGSLLGTGDYEKAVGGNISQLLTGEFGNTEYQYDETPCMSNEDNIKTIIANVKKALSDTPSASRVEIGINDSASYCRCKLCSDNYRKYGGRSATLVLLANRVSEAIAEEFPNVYIRIGAYTYVIAPPKNLELRDNIAVRYITVTHCSGHEYTDTTCTINEKLTEQVAKWGELACELHVWDHCGAFIYMMTPYPDWDSMLHNMRYFAECGATQVLMNSVLNSGDEYSDFGYMRCSLYSRIYMDPFMSEEEFEYMFSNYLRAYYGDGWQSIKKYTEKIAELGNSRHHSNHASTSGFYDYDEVEEQADYIDALWEDAMSMAEGNELVRLELAHTSWLYLRQCAVYEKRYQNGTDEQREEYRQINRYLYEYVSEHDVCWTENILTGDMNPINAYSDSNSPERW